jgi:hypothetical protein
VVARWAVIALVSCSYIGCAGLRTGSAPADRSRSALRLLTADAAERAAVLAFAAAGSGPFALDAAGSCLVPDPGSSGHPPRLARIDLVEPRGRDAADLLRSGAVDVAVLYGSGARDLLGREGRDPRIERLPGWDKTYALWLRPAGRWLVDPAFRRWIARATDREALVQVLFAGLGEPAFALSDPAAQAPREEPPARPWSRGSSPELGLLFDADDRHAGAVAARLAASMHAAGATLRREGVPGAEHRRRIAGGRFEMALVAHRPPVRDPVLGLAETLRELGAEVGSRRSAALAAEESLLREARLVPLARSLAFVAARA